MPLSFIIVMEIYIVPFIAVILGYLIALVMQPKNKQVVKLLLAFSGAFLLTMTVSHLLPEVYANEIVKVEHSHSHEHDEHIHDENCEHSHENPSKHIHNEEEHVHDEHCSHGSEDAHIHHDHGMMKHIGLFIMLGIIFQIVLEYFSRGAEHGHTHTHEHQKAFPLTLFISLCIHALFEGMPISQHSHLAWGIAIHHFPIAIILTLFFIQGGLNKKIIALFMILFAAMTPAGTYISDVLPFLQTYYTEISAFVIGILFHISSTIIFESSEGHKFNATKMLAIVLGIALGYMIN